MSNPFNFGTPVPPHRMVGRWHQVEYIAHDLVDLGGLSHMVVGGRRFGKSSFLEAIRYTLVKQFDQRRSGNWYFIPVIVNLQRLTEHSVGGVFNLILELLYMCFDPGSAAKTLGHFFPMELEKTKLYSYIQKEQKECSLGDFSKIIDDYLRACLKRSKDSQSAHHQTSHSNVDHGFTALGKHFKVQAEPSALSNPSKGPFNHPAPRQEDKAFLIIRAQYWL